MTPRAATALGLAARLFDPAGGLLERAVYARTIKARSVHRRPELSFPAAGRTTVLVISAHADDEALGCAAAVRSHLARGDRVIWLVLCDGRNANGGIVAPGEMAAARRREAEALLSHYRWHKLLWWGIMSPWLSIQGHVQRCAEIVAREGVGMIYAPFVYNHHPEHRLAGMLASASTPAEVPIRYYAVQTPLTPTFTTSLYASDTGWTYTKAALHMYTSQQFMARSFDAAIRVSRLEALLFRADGPYVQCFHDALGPNRHAIIVELATLAKDYPPVKPNRSIRLWRDYERAWERADKVFSIAQVSS
jgi:LmbE family N-acetylglucosaminyl deacetylase